MKKIINWTKRWSFLLMVVIVGVGYLTIFDQWRVYAKPLQELQQRWQMLCICPDTVEMPVMTENSSGSKENALAVSIGDADSERLADETVQEDASVSSGNAQENFITESVSSGDGISGQSPAEVVYRSVEDDYFQDAVFIGDSRTVGLYEYAGWEEISTFYASTGLTIHKLFDAPIVELEGQKKKGTVEQALSERSFSKIYLMIGINEMGTGTVDSFMETYKQAVEHLRELQPDAIIYLQGIMKVTTERSQQGDYITNAGIEERNARIAELADNVTVYYLDVNPLICDETGGMEASYTFDGVHLKAQYISIWKDYLKTHAVDHFLLD